MCYDFLYELHDNVLSDCCLQTRLMCEQRFATLESFMLELERSQCRCGRGTWCRTKSFFESIKKRALSPIRSLRKSQSAAEREQERELESPSEKPCALSVKEMPVHRRESGVVELPFQHALISELPHDGPVSELDACAVPSWACPPQRRNDDAPSAAFHTTPSGNGSARCMTGPDMPPTPASLDQILASGHRIFELSAPLPNTTSPTTTPYGGVPSTLSTGVSSMSGSSASAQSSSSFVTPQSSISSIPTSVPAAPASAVTGATLFANHTTYSPVEYEQDDHIVPWDKHPNSTEGGVWSSTSTAAELPASFPEPALDTSRWLQKHGPAGYLVPPAKTDPFNPYPIPSVIQPSSRTELAVSRNGNSSDAQELPADVTPTVAASPAGGSKRLLDLDNVGRTFSRLRQNPAWTGVSVVSLSQLSGHDALLVGIDELESLRQGCIRDTVLSKLCFAYLALAMATELGDAVPQHGHVILFQGMAEFVRTDGESGLPDAFLDVANQFLYALHAQINSQPDQRHALRRLGSDERRPTLLALGFMRQHFQTHTAQPRRPEQPVPQTRHHSWNSTTSTILDVVMHDGDDNDNDNDNNSNNTTVEGASSETFDPLLPADGCWTISDPPSQQRQRRPGGAAGNNPNLKRNGPPPPPPPSLSSSAAKQAGRNPKPPPARQASAVCCVACGFYPAGGPDQRKKMGRHVLTDKHRRNTGQGRGAAAADAERRFPCPACSSAFNRRDNLRQHVRKRHRDRGGTPGQGHGQGQGQGQQQQHRQQQRQQQQQQQQQQRSAAQTTLRGRKYASRKAGQPLCLSRLSRAGPQGRGDVRIGFEIL
ncbi:hypothetical protein VTK26DRAFT_8400 [Humicola hyalothermophila]